MKKFIIILLIFFLNICSSIIFADTNIHLSLTPERGTTNTDFFLQVSVSSKNLESIGFPNFLESEEFELKAKSTSISEQIINGDASYQKTFLYSVVPKHSLLPGEYQIPKGTIIISNEKFRFPTKSIVIEPATTFNNNLLKENKNEGFTFIQLVSKENPFVGEQISYRVEIIAPTNLVKAELEEFEPEGVWRERFGKEEKSQRKAYNITINSFSEAWFPISVGDLEIPKRILRSELRQVSNIRRNNFGSNNFGGIPGSLADQFLNGMLPMIGSLETIEKSIETPEIKIKVRPLPKPPHEIKGYIPVGDLTVTSSVDSDQVKAGEPITLTIEASGDANIRPLELGEELNKNDSYNRYDDKPIIKRIVQGQRVTYFKTFKLTLIPSKEGLIKIPQFKINWFDPQSETYKSEITIDKLITVTENKLLLNGENKLSEIVKTDTTETPITKTDNKDDQELIKEKLISYQKNVFILSNNKVLVIGLLPFILLFILLILEKINSKSNKNSPSNTLKNLIKILNEDDTLVSLNNLQHQLKFLLEEKYSLNALTKTADEIIFSSKNSLHELSDIANLIKEIEILSYSENKDLSKELRNKIISVLKGLK